MRSYLRDGRRENNNLVKLADSLHELINSRSLYDVNVVVVALDFDRDCEVCLMQNLA